jgi:hypothetical protein
MTEDDLSAPLGQDRRPRRQHALRVSLSQTVVTALGFLAIAFAAWAMIADHPSGGEPIAVVPAPLHASRPVSNPDQTSADIAEPAADGARHSQDSLRTDAPASVPPATRTVTIIDGTSGKRQEIVIPGTANPGSTEAQADGSPRRGAVAKAMPEARTPARSTPAR